MRRIGIVVIRTITMKNISVHFTVAWRLVFGAGFTAIPEAIQGTHQFVFTVWLGPFCVCIAKNKPENVYVQKSKKQIHLEEVQKYWNNPESFFASTQKKPEELMLIFNDTEAVKMAEAAGWKREDIEAACKKSTC